MVKSILLIQMDPHHVRRPYPPAIVDMILHLHIVQDKTYKEISDTFGGKPCPRTIGDYCRLYTGSNNTPVYKQGQLGRTRWESRKMSLDVLDSLEQIVVEEELYRMEDIASHLNRRFPGRQISEVDVSRGLGMLGFGLVRVTQQAQERDEAKRDLFRFRMSRCYYARQLVFLDEVSTVSNRLYTSTSASCWCRI